MKTMFGHPIYVSVARPSHFIRKLAIKQYSRGGHALAQSKENLPYTPLSTRTTGVTKGMILKWKWL